MYSFTPAFRSDARLSLPKLLFYEHEKLRAEQAGQPLPSDPSLQQFAATHFGIALVYEQRDTVVDNNGQILTVVKSRRVHQLQTVAVSPVSVVVFSSKLASAAKIVSFLLISAKKHRDAIVAHLKETNKVNFDLC